MNTKPRHPFVQYFANVWSGIRTTYLGMKLTIGYFFRKPVTMQYPEVKPVIPAGHRGIHKFYEDKCLVCQSCARACPVDAIEIKSEGKGKDALLTKFEINYTTCLFCNLCCEACPTDCLEMSEQYDLAGYGRGDCFIDFARPKSPEQIKAHLEEIARKEAEKKAAREAAAKQKAEADAAAAQAAQE